MLGTDGRNVHPFGKFETRVTAVAAGLLLSRKSFLIVFASQVMDMSRQTFRRRICYPAVATIVAMGVMVDDLTMHGSTGSDMGS